MVKDTAALTGEIAQDEAYRVPVRYYHVEHMKEDHVESCQGDLIIICEYSNASEPPFYRLRATSDFNT